ncbi:leucine-rich repeat domain-containing protein [Acanthopleuribacter pedis]|uniref:Leucine-rich repeat domain-containing protein n=1 Tax=Acanthopleuribacter pedis TaxID=442870 RepID=A0A8J7Q600_9BACT|nr:leucine-rich repeat domain-containing protein [Acanthopleuribacter pedis]MBO1321112.1 leucine-rich repeat domain-containing protein [Acanthopleuribacter pedis]
MLMNHLGRLSFGPLAFLMVWYLSTGPLPAQTFEQTTYETPDYRIGLHTHQGYPAEMAALLDEELMQWRGVRAGWADADLNHLIDHANQFNAPLLSHGGISWRIERRDLAVAVVQQTPLRLRVDPLQALHVGDFLFHAQGAFRVAVVAADGLITLQPFQGDSLLPKDTGRLSVYRAVLHEDAAQSLRELTVARVMVQLVLLPALDDPLPPLFFQENRGDAGIGVGANAKAAAPLFAHPRFQPPALPAVGKRADERALFVRQLTRDLIAQITAAARTENGGSKIAYWLLGNEPDSLIPVAPDRYLDWLTAFHDLLRETEAPGQLVLANLSGYNPGFDGWLHGLQEEMEQRLEDGRLDPAARPFEAVAITHYLTYDSFETKALREVTERLQRVSRDIAALFTGARPLQFIAKELAFAGQPAEHRTWAQSGGDGELRPEIKQRIRAYLNTLKSMGYDDLVWFNQMPTGYGHGRLIDSVTNARETGLGRFLRLLNQPVASPLLAEFKTADGFFDFRLLFESTRLGYSGGRFTLWAEDAAGNRLAVSRGVLNGDTMQADGRFFLDTPAAALHLRFETGHAENETFFWSFAPVAAPRQTAALVKRKEVIDIPDIAFARFLLARFDANEDGLLTTDEVADVEEIDWELPSTIKDLTGLDAFANLKTLRIVYGSAGNIPIHFPSLADLPLRAIRLFHFYLSEPLVTPPELERLSMTLVGDSQSADLRGSPRLNSLYLRGARQPLFGKHVLRDLSFDGVVVDDPAGFSQVRVTEQCLIQACRVAPRFDLGGMGFGGRVRMIKTPFVLLRADLSEVTHLFLDDNNLTSDSLDRILQENDWDALEVLDVRNALLDRFPDLANVPGLKNLRLIRCDLPGLPAVSLPPNLTSLNLAENQMTEVVFSPSTALQGLDLSGNRLEIAVNLRGLPNLLRLDVSDNRRLPRIDGLPFCRGLESLYFRNTNIPVFPDLRVLPRLARVYGYGSPLVDQCGEAELYMTSSHWQEGDGFRTPTNTNLLCTPDEREQGPVFPDRPLRALSWVPQGDQWLLTWKGGTRRNYQPERVKLTGVGAWTNEAGGSYETRRRIMLAEADVAFELAAVAEPDEAGSSPQIDVQRFSLQQQAAPWVYILPHVPLDRGWSQVIELSAAAGAVTVDLEGVAPDGVVVFTKQLTLAPGQTQSESIDALIEPLDREVLHWMRLRADGPLDAFQVLGRRESDARTRDRLQPAYALEGVAHLPPRADHWFAGLVFVNPGSQPASLMLWHHNDHGALIGRETLTLQPGQQWKVLADDAFALQRRASLLRWASDVSLREMVLYGNRRPFTHLFSEWQTDTVMSRGFLEQVTDDTELTFLNSEDNITLIRLFQGDEPDSERRVTLTPWGVQTVSLRDLYADPTAGPIRFEADSAVGARALFFQSGKRTRFLAGMRSFTPISD